MWKIFSSHDGAVQIIHSIAERDLRERQPHADPVGGEMIEVIEIDAADGEVAQLIEGGGACDVGQGPCSRPARRQKEQSR